MEFQAGDRVMLKVSHWKGIIRFRKRRKLSPRFLGPFTMLKRVGLQAYQLEFPPEMIGIHNIVDESNHCVEEPDTILDRKSKKLRDKEVTMVKVQYKQHRGANVTWEAEEDMKRIYPHLFL
ncbi:hypothetical protein L6452_43477 [Arctium lappa]|uniref:Uncharacterized protein n=1 Tax=Arctium lappa TaxID=4217 RepID=A0ACB8XDQ0_ARCLA|nr:hypothetical protein L6452_43477 [Arctium lappa]